MVAESVRATGESRSACTTVERRTPIEELLDDARRGGGSALVVAGDGRAEAPADTGDFLVLRARAVETERELPFAALADLLRPALHLLGRIPVPQECALRAAFALGPPAGDERLAICAGTLALLETAAEATPVLLVLDDAQWVDPASAEPLLYSFRRLDGTRVAALVSVRAAAMSAFLGTGLPELVAGPEVPVPDDRPQELVAAADAAKAAGKRDKAVRLLDDALDLADDALVRADAVHRREVISMWSAAPAQAARRLLAEAERIAPLDAERATSMTADAAWACFMAGDLESGLAAAEHASQLGAAAGGVVEVLGTGVLGIARLLTGRSGEALPLLQRFAPLLDDVRFLERAYSAAWPAALALVWLEEYGQARDAFTTLVDFARTRGTPAMLPFALVGLSELEFRTGDWTAARAAAEEATHIAEETGQPVAHAFALLALARVAGPQGREADCTAHVFEAVRLAPSGAGAVLAYAGTRLGALELALGRSEATVSHLEQVDERAAEHGLADPGVIQWAPDLIESCLRSSRRDQAVAALERLERQARATDRVWARATAARCRGLLADADDFETAFLEARDWHGRIDTPFDRARTELCFGERLRRARRRADARGPLRDALAIFERLGAEPWAARARAELRATGEATRGATTMRTDELTPQEQEIARLVARGATNREAAAALYLSPKTIEAHLGHVYRKLGVRSRTELARLLA